MSAERRVRQLDANLERMRWLPRDLGDRAVVVNIPAFRLQAFEQGRAALTMKVVVGREWGDRETPVFADSMATVVINPYWNVPAGIARDEIVPKARRDRGYLTAHDYEVVHGWGNDAPTISPWSVTSAQLAAIGNGYRIRQRPGPGNALGRIKFLFPNDYAVYLHDTPADQLFDERVRAFSHGCVRVEAPVALAAWVLGQQGWDASRVRSAMATRDRRPVTLDRKIPVYLMYLTAFGRDGTLHFRDDIYDLDQRLIARLDGTPSEDGSAAAARLAEMLGVAGS